MPTKAQQLAKARAEGADLLHRQAKEQTRFHKGKKGSPMRRRAKARLNRLKGLIRTALARIRRLERKQRSGGADAAVENFMQAQGISEKPDGSNWGHPVQDYIIYTGYDGPVPWCGCGAAWFVIRHGKAKIANRIRLGYTGWIVEDARADRNGLREVRLESGKKGDLVVFKFGHIAVLRADVQAGGTIQTIEANTSPLTSGSQNDGGTIAAKTRSKADVTCIARVAYPKSN